MKIGILGTGDVGKALGRGFIGLGHSVTMGARDAANPKAAAWVKETGPRASAATFAAAAQNGEVIVIATLGTATEEILRGVGPSPFKGKLVIDATNPLDMSKGAPKLIGGVGDSGAERHQKLLPGAHVVKAFNTVGNALMYKPVFAGGPPDMFICGNDAAAKQVVTGFCTDLGWGVVDAGGIEGARLLEPMCILWVVHGIRTGSWNHAFKLLHT